MQVTFIRDADGMVNSLVHHQGGAEAKPCLDAEVAARAEETWSRKREKIPQLDSEQTLRRVIANSLRGEPDYEMMSPVLAALAREQHDLVIAELKSVGPLRALTFRGVGQSGVDVYDAKFDNAEMEWGIFIGRNGKLTTLYFRKLP